MCTENIVSDRQRKFSAQLKMNMFIQLCVCYSARSMTCHLIATLISLCHASTLFGNKFTGKTKITRRTLRAEEMTGKFRAEQKCDESMQTNTFRPLKMPNAKMQTKSKNALHHRQHRTRYSWCGASASASCRQNATLLAHIQEISYKQSLDDGT